MPNNKKAGSPKKLVSRREFLVGGGAVIAAAVLTACAPGTTTQTSRTTTITTRPTSSAATPSAAITPKTTQATSTISSAASALVPKSGGTLRCISFPIPANIGWPPEMVGYGGSGVLGYFETLFCGDDQGNVVPWLAESYKVADDLKSITINLRQGVRFHDGSELNAEGAKWSLENYIQSKMQPNWSSVDKISDYTVRVNFTEWKNTLPASFGDNDPAAYMLSKAAFDKNGKEWMRANPIGTGPFKFAGFKQDVELKGEKFSDYWIKGKPYLDRVNLIMIADPVTSRMQMQSGDADIITIMHPKDAVDFTNMGLKVESFIFITWALVPDTANPDSPWANPKVREAVDYVIDREGIAKAFGYGYWKPCYQIPPSFTVAYDPNFPLARKYDPDKAKQLLTEAGYGSGLNTTIIVNSVADRNIATSIQTSLAKAGITVNLEFPEMGKWVSYMGPQATWKNAALFTLFPAIDRSYTGGLQWMFVQLGQSWKRTPEMEAGLAAAISAPVQDVKLVRAVTDMMSKESLIIPINELANAAAMKPNLIGYKRGVVVETWENMWFDK